MSSKITCKICGEEFAEDKSLHHHLKKHGVTMAEYYTQYYPRFNLLNGDPLPFKNKEQYFGADFSTRQQLLKWCATEDREKVAPYILKMLERRIESKGLSLGPSHLELKLSSMPTIDVYQENFGSYSFACKELGVKPMFKTRLPKKLFESDLSDMNIFIDTREQKPLEFSNSTEMKLDVGDYTSSGDDYSYTYVDRKGEQDFKSTLSKHNLDRFDSELQRAKDMGAYLYIVTESDLSQIYKNNKWGHRSNLKYIFHNMRVFAHKYAGTCQFLFTGSREKSEKLIPELLKQGDSLWDVDIQYYIDNDELGHW
jgi:hypothetical protein